MSLEDLYRKLEHLRHEMRSKAEECDEILSRMIKFLDNHPNAYIEHPESVDQE
jgi:hypothetical protein